MPKAICSKERLEELDRLTKSGSLSCDDGFRVLLTLVAALADNVVELKERVKELEDPRPRKPVGTACVGCGALILFNESGDTDRCGPCTVEFEKFINA